MAVTPSKSAKMPLGEVRKICLDYTIAGLETISQLPRGNEAKPLRFVYVSGANSERDQSKKPMVMGDYCLMRVSIQNLLLPVLQQRKKKSEEIIA